MPNRLIRRLAWVTIGAAAALTPRLLRHARSIVSSASPPESKPSSLPVTSCELSGDSNDRPLQQLTRYRNSQGGHVVLGRLLAEFRTGERTSTLAIAFCPPFERLPSVEAEIVDESGASVKVTQYFHNGAQFEVRLPGAAADHASVTLEFIAIEPPPSISS